MINDQLLTDLTQFVLLVIPAQVMTLEAKRRLAAHPLHSAEWGMGSGAGIQSAMTWTPAYAGVTPRKVNY